MRLIDADKAKAELLSMIGDIHGWGEFFDGIRGGYRSAADKLDTMPVEEERKHGHWIQVDDTKCKCSACEITHLIAQYPSGDKNYCPYCGAKMDGE